MPETIDIIVKIDWCNAVFYQRVALSCSYACECTECIADLFDKLFYAYICTKCKADLLDKSHFEHIIMLNLKYVFRFRESFHCYVIGSQFVKLRLFFSDFNIAQLLSS